VGTVSFAQDNNVGIGTTQPDQSAILDLSSNTKGFLTPRMTQAQRDLILTPAQGLQIFQTDGQAGLYLFDGQQWVNSTAGTSAALDPWLAGGNTASGSHFFGTLNGVPLKIRVNNQASGMIDNSYSTSTTNYGYKAGQTNSGLRNTAFGFESMSQNFNASANDNTALGTYAMRGTAAGVSAAGNTAIGAYSLYEVTSGSYNMGIGIGALRKTNTGGNNLAIGNSALTTNTTGQWNVAIGSAALVSSLSGNNNVAIGGEAGRLLTGSNNIMIGYQAGKNETSISDKLFIANSATTTPLIYGDFSAKYVTIGDVTPALRSQGVATGGYNLLVKGGILTEKIKVALAATGTDWADYVFDDTYSLMPLTEVETFTKTNKHLPNVPSAEEMVSSGLDVAQTSKMFMEKIEELTLYVIELNKEIQTLKSETSKLK
jgi:hypothetical protein